MPKQNNYFYIALLWTIVVTYLSLMQVSNTILSQSWFKHQDKLVHFSFYFIFTFVWYLATNTSKNPIKSIRTVVTIAIVYGIVMEFCQGLFTSFRSPDLLDVLANSAGAIAAAFVLKLCYIKK